MRTLPERCGHTSRCPQRCRRQVPSRHLDCTCHACILRCTTQ